MNSNSRKRSSSHFNNRDSGRPCKVYLDRFHQICKANSWLNQPDSDQQVRFSRKRRAPEVDQNMRKCAKSDINDDIESLRLSLEKWSNKENDVIEPIKKTSGPRIWHIETFIEQNVYDL